MRRRQLEEEIQPFLIASYSNYIFEKAYQIENRKKTSYRRIHARTHEPTHTHTNEKISIQRNEYKKNGSKNMEYK